MTILLLANHASPHIIKWASALAQRGYRTAVFSLTAEEVYHYPPELGIEVISAGIPLSAIRTKGSQLTKLRYLKTVSLLKRTIARLEPDIVHAHRAPSYGLLGVLSGFRPLITSVWGEDIFSFPEKSPLHRWELSYVLARGGTILSTSRVMADETRRYTDKEVQVTPFGIDLETFRPFEASAGQIDAKFRENDIIVGTVKTLEARYGVDYLVRAFARLMERRPELPLKLLVVGGGSQHEELQRLAAELVLEERTVFTGRVPFAKIPRYHNMLDVAVFASVTDSESFGVAVIEASACERPVVVSDVGGLPEVVADGETGIIVPRRDAERTAEAVERLVDDPVLREKMGKAGRSRVKELYDWERNVDLMCSIYDDVVERQAHEQ